MGVDHDRGRLDRAKRADRLADEIGIAGRVDQIESLAGMVEMDDRRFDRVFVGFFHLVEIADTGAVVNAGRPMDRAAWFASSMSASVVLPAAPCPQKAMLRMSCTLNLAIGRIPLQTSRRMV